jgi:DNA-binding PucR family transcriptional regulator
LHENTIRYRLNRFRAMTGLDVGNPTDQLSVHVALLVLRLRGVLHDTPGEVVALATRAA